MSEITTILKYLPVFTFSVITLSISVVYLWSSFGGYVTTFPLPTISETGNLWPMNSIFCFGLSLSAFCFFLVIIVKAIYDIQKINFMRSLIKKSDVLGDQISKNQILLFLIVDIPAYLFIGFQYLSVFIGSISCILLAMVGSINMGRNLDVHNITAAAFFGVAIIYCWTICLTTIVMKILHVSIKYTLKFQKKMAKKSQEMIIEETEDNKQKDIFEEIRAFSNFAPFSMIFWRLGCTVFMTILVPIAIYSREQWVNQHLGNWKNGLSICEYLGVLLIAFVFVSFSYDFTLFDLKITMDIKRFEKCQKKEINKKLIQKLIQNEENQTNLYVSDKGYDNGVNTNEHGNDEKRRLIGNVQQGQQEEEDKLEIFNN